DVLAFSRETQVCLREVVATEVVEDALLRVADLLSSETAPQVIRGPGLADRVTLQADRAQLVQALVNVIRNGIEACLEQSPTGGGTIALDVRTSAGIAGSGRRMPMVVFRVQDSGPGVSEQVVQRMFNPFFTTRAAGTGLGLPIVHRIIEAHGGRVVVSNNAGPGKSDRGACVELHVPQERSAAGEGSQIEAKPEHAHCVMERAG
ncbi:MAG: sensor histidine kinase, partial [Planctomycetota bacterium]